MAPTKTIALPSPPYRDLLRSLVAQKQLAGVAGWSFLSALIARGANVVALVICARILPQEHFGQLAIIQSTVGMFAPVAGLGLAIVLILLAPQLAAQGFASPGLSMQLIQASGLLAFGVFEAVQTGALTGLEAFPRIARLSIWNGVLSIPAITILAYTYGAPGAIAGLTLSLAAACVLNTIALHAECRKWGIQPSLKNLSAERHMLLTFSLPSYLSGIIVAPVTWLSSALLVHQPGGFSEMALFTAADRFRYLLIFLPLAVSRIAVPALSRFRSAGDHGRYLDTFRWNLGFGLLATIPPALLIIGFAPPLMALFGEAFRRGWPVLACSAMAAPGPAPASMSFWPSSSCSPLGSSSPAGMPPASPWPLPSPTPQPRSCCGFSPPAVACRKLNPPLHLLHPGWTLALPFLALTCLMLCRPDRQLYTSLISTSIYALMQLWCESLWAVRSSFGTPGLVWTGRCLNV